MRTRLVCTVVFLVCALASSTGSAQTLAGQLSLLLTEQVPTSQFVPDIPAAEGTRDTVARLFSIELSNLPVATSSGGFVYRLNPSLGVVERASDGFGPFFTERVLGNGEGQISLGVSFQFGNFSSLQGANLESGTFPTNAARTVGSTQPFSVDTLALKLDTRTTTLFASVGMSDRLAIGASLPLTRVHFSGTRTRTEAGRTTLQSSQSGSSAGLGDATLTARYIAAGSGPRGVSLGVDLKLPTGSEADLLGSGHVGARFLGVTSYEEGRLAVSLNGGAGVGGASRELFWSMATTFAAAPRLTIVGELLGRRLSELSYVQDVYQPHPLMPGVETMRWLTAERGVVTTMLVTGAKWNVAQSLLLNTNLLISVTDGGLRSRVMPAFSFNYHFDQ